MGKCTILLATTCVFIANCASNAQTACTDFIPITQAPRVSKVCLYRDTSGLFRTSGAVPSAASAHVNDDVSDDDYLFKSKYGSQQQDSVMLSNGPAFA